MPDWQPAFEGKRGLYFVNLTVHVNRSIAMAKSLTKRNLPRIKKRCPDFRLVGWINVTYIFSHFLDEALHISRSNGLNQMSLDEIPDTHKEPLCLTGSRRS